MTAYAQAPSMPLVLEFLGSATVDEVSDAIEQAIRHRYVLTVELTGSHGSSPDQNVMVNFGALEDVVVRVDDPRDDPDWDDRLIYSLALAEFRDAARADPDD